jgi:hypothetical protein
LDRSRRHSGCTDTDHLYRSDREVKMSMPARQESEDDPVEADAPGTVASPDADDVIDARPDDWGGRAARGRSSAAAAAADDDGYMPL